MIKLAVFDWNGTILSDVRYAAEASNAELAILGHPPITLKDYQQHFAVPLIKFFSALGIDLVNFEQKSSEIAAAFHASYEPKIAHAKTRPGSRALLKGLHQQGVRCVILSNHTLEGIYPHLERLKLTRYFEAVLANDTLVEMHAAGKADRLKHYLAAQNLKGSEAFIIGDTIEEITIGKAFGLTTVSITGGFSTPARLKQAKPDILVHKMSDVLPAIKEKL